nr:hypothetical protein [Tanacetum cinerariifolium]
MYMQASLQQEPVVGQFAADHSDKQTYGRRPQRYDIREPDPEYVPQRYDIREPDPEYVSLEDLAPLAMNKIEALSIEGLRIQSGMSDKDASSNISPQSIGEISALEDDDDGIMGLSVTLDEWMRLNSGEIDEGDEMSERTLKILAAHHASDLMRAKRGKGSKKGGLLGNNFTVALMVQLRDPLRNFKPVGTLILALVQVERVFVPSKPKIYSSIYSLWNKPVEEEGEIKAGSRWLVANRMGKKNAKHPLMKSKAATSDKSSGSLWSISSKGKGSVIKVDPPVRNPNVIIPNETVRLLSGAYFV